ncbi:acyltransferase [Vibrio hippocampi]|uniref:2,3,4,5-tetrahydropyridine-2,6-dicarboxylate N-acetyltransferase n=1 Tax=Vibrio hippocampi TaxID=654686 RepID=A0ABM8ZPI2_9VIBR|nr:acyltransferase [Vibrio hippocampi]CAH0529987.1 2,3,4,5-tetrahydropyridine-2,6-dicarboxylate N-acetyltransferase [Vibrio hippocampi]
MSVQEKFGGELSDEEFRKFTLYTSQSNNKQDDETRAQILGFTNANVRVAPGAIIRIGDNQIGCRSYIGLYSYINGDVEIGEEVAIGPHVSVVASNHVFDPATQSFSARSCGVKGKVIIENGVWLTTGVVVTPGVTIGRGSLVCANSVVTCGVEPYSIVAGSPAKVVGRIDAESGEYHWHNKE